MSVNATKAANAMLGGDTQYQDIPLDHLDYKYIGECNNVKELEKIYKVLKSGQEGVYPHLEKTCEQKLQSLAPNSKALRKEVPLGRLGDLDKEEQALLTDDLKNFFDSMKEKEQQFKKPNNVQDENKKDHLPPPRSTQNPTTITVEGKPVQKPKSNKRVKPRDYREWDKVDVEKELEKLDEEDASKQTKNVLRKSGKPERIQEILEDKGLTDEEKELRANREKDKGNEAFRSGDFDEAAVYYTRSISLCPTAASYNNRALAYVKLEKWDSAIKDCNKVLQMEPKNVKALLRKGVSLQGKNDNKKAKMEFEKVLSVEPNNKRAKELLEQVNSKIDEVKSKGRRMVIEEVEGSSSESEDEVVVHEVERNETVETKGHVETEIKTQEKEQTEKLTNGFVENNDNATKPEDQSENKSTVENEFEQKQSNKSDSTEVGKVEKSLDAEKEQAAENGSKALPSDLSNETANEQTYQPPKFRELCPPSLPKHVSSLKEEGNAKFRTGQYAEAIQKYDEGIRILSKDEQHQFVHLSTLYSNRAACKSKIGDCRGCIEDCTKALELLPHSLKALLRRGAAYEMLEKYKQAYVDYKHALAVDSTVDIAYQGSTRTGKYLKDLYGLQWREKLSPIPVVRKEDIPVIVSDGGTSNQGSSSQGSQNVAIATGKSPETPTKSQEELFQEMKSLGNTAVQKGNFPNAIQCYCSCLDMFKDRAVIYTNRALCYLRLNKASEALNDCDTALNLEENNIKALFRRAQAKKMLKQYKDSISDLTKLLKVDPKNSAAKKELELVKNYWREELNSLKREQPSKKDQSKTIQTEKSGKSEVKPRKKMLIEEVENSSEEEEENSSNAKSSNTVTASANASTEQKPTASSEMTKKDNKISEETSVKPTSISGLPKAAPSVPQLSSKPTPYEFMQAWTSLKSAEGTQPYAALLGQIKPEELPKVLSNKLDGHMMKMILKCLNEHFAESDAGATYGYLRNLYTAKRFDMVKMFMDAEDKNVLKHIFTRLHTHTCSGYTDQQILSMKKKYGL